MVSSVSYASNALFSFPCQKWVIGVKKMSGIVPIVRHCRKWWISSAERRRRALGTWIVFHCCDNNNSYVLLITYTKGWKLEQVETVWFQESRPETKDKRFWKFGAEFERVGSESASSGSNATASREFRPKRKLHWKEMARAIANVGSFNFSNQFHSSILTLFSASFPLRKIKTHCMSSYQQAISCSKRRNSLATEAFLARRLAANTANSAEYIMSANDAIAIICILFHLHHCAQFFLCVRFPLVGVYLQLRKCSFTRSCSLKCRNEFH